jgi:hypothetical protein
MNTYPRSQRSDLAPLNPSPDTGARQVRQPFVNWAVPSAYPIERRRPRVDTGEWLRSRIIERDKSSKGEVLFVVMGACAAVWVVGLKYAGVL